MWPTDWDEALCLCVAFNLPCLPAWIVNNAMSKALDGTHVEKALQFWPHFVLLTKRGPSLMTVLCFGRAPHCCRARGRLSPERLSTSCVELLPKLDTRTAGPFFICTEKEQEEQFNNSHKNVSQSTQSKCGWCVNRWGSVWRGGRHIRWEGRNRPRSIHCPPKDINVFAFHLLHFPPFFLNEYFRWSLLNLIVHSCLVQRQKKSQLIKI